MRTRTKVLIAVAGLVTATSLGLASGSFTWGAFSPSGTKVFQVEHWDGAHTVLTATRGPVDVTTATMPVSAQVTIATTGVLTSMSLQTGDDTNSNGMIDVLEWTTIATGVIVQQGGTTTGTIASTNVPLNVDAIRIRMNRTDIGNVWDVVHNGSKQIDYTQ